MESKENIEEKVVKSRKFVVEGRVREREARMSEVGRRKERELSRQRRKEGATKN